MAFIQSVVSSTTKLAVDPTSLAARTTLYDSEGKEVTTQSKATYSAATTFTAPASGLPSDLITISGSATKIVRICSFVIMTTNTAAGSQYFSLILRNAPNLGGVFVAATAVPHDSNDGAATVTVGHYTTVATTLAKQLGVYNDMNISSSVAVPASFAGVQRPNNISGREMLPLIAGVLKPITFRMNAGFTLALFQNGAIVAGQTHAYRIVWTEE